MEYHARRLAFIAAIIIFISLCRAFKCPKRLRWPNGNGLPSPRREIFAAIRDGVNIYMATLPIRQSIPH
ncbi:hypothetical protein SAMN04488061_2610 [Filomicrobium insigne]|uniref:Uncharacterized protein n=1 Tax=Filomicrobium insigne TaxID=418854 RepID=A0A1H0R4H3_9HYPH|nr:hypothetical protein SAMN04488061_2610 [Filomicrobium insigne]